MQNNKNKTLTPVVHALRQKHMYAELHKCYKWLEIVYIAFPRSSLGSIKLKCLHHSIPSSKVKRLQ